MTRSIRRILSLFCLSVLVLPAGSRAAAGEYEWAIPEWRATYAAPRLADNRGFAVATASDGVYVAGVAGSRGVGPGDVFLLKYALDGALLWERTWGGLELDQAHDLLVSGSDIFVVGQHERADGVIVGTLLRFSTSGSLVYQRSFVAGVSTVLQAVSGAPGGRLYIGGFAHPTRENRDAYAATVNAATGAIVWTATRDGGGWDEIWDIDTAGDMGYASGYTSRAGETSQAAIYGMHYAYQLGVEPITFGGEGNDEARGIAVSGMDLYLTGGSQSGRSTDVFVAKYSREYNTFEWVKTTGGDVVGGGGYGIAVGERGIYVAGGTYDFPAGGDSALMRFSFDGDLEWTQVHGLPGFWDWNFDVAVQNGRFYTTGVLWQPGLEWYRVTTTAYDEEFPTATPTRVGAWMQDGDDTRTSKAMDAFSIGDFQRWAQSRPAPSGPGRVYAQWEGASDSGRQYGRAWVDSSSPELVGEENFTGAISALQNDFGSGNYSLVRDFTGIRVEVLDGFVRARYYISHDRLIPQGGYLFVGELGIGIPPPPV